jgi:hypothetical protein
MKRQKTYMRLDKALEMFGFEDGKVTIDRISKRFRQLAVQYHPDKNLGNKEKEELFKRASRAKDSLLQHIGEEIEAEPVKEHTEYGDKSTCKVDWDIKTGKVKIKMNTYSSVKGHIREEHCKVLEQCFYAVCPDGNIRIKYSPALGYFVDQIGEVHFDPENVITLGRELAVATNTLLQLIKVRTTLEGSSR